MTDNRFRTAPGGDPAKKRNNTHHFTSCNPGTFLPIGLNHVDLGKQGNARLNAYVDNAKPVDNNLSAFSAHIHVDTWADTVLYDAGCSWLDVSQHSTDFQVGTWSIGDCNGAEKSIPITFKKSYDQAPPQIIVWIRTIDIDKGANARVHAYATDVTTTGFKLHVGTWHHETHIYDTHVSWIAVPTNRPNLTAGVVNTGHLKSDSPTKGKFIKDIVFDKAFKRAPHVAVALNKIDSSNQANMRLSTHVENVTPQGFKLVIETWSDTVIYDSGVGYVVVGEF